MAIDIEWIKNIRHDRVKAASLVAFVILALFAYILLIKIDMGIINRLRTRYVEAVQILDIAKKTSEYQAYIGQFNSSFTINKDTNWLIEILNQIAADKNIRIDSIKPLPIGLIAEYRIVRVAVDGEATYVDIANFINSIENYAGSLFIEELELSIKEAQQGASLQTDLFIPWMEVANTTAVENKIGPNREMASPSEIASHFKLIISFLYT